MTRVKICGITNWADAKLAVDAGADAIGLNFYAPSPRAVTPAAAWEIVRKLPPFVEPVGVFVNWSPATVDALAGAIHLDAVQLHGDETPADVAALAARHSVIKAFRVGNKFRASQLRGYREVAAFLLDSSRGGLWGGTGKHFDWSVARKSKRFGRIILAGGITPENVAEAIRAVKPYAVDVASGVESRPGKKDAGKMRELMREVERANLELGRVNWEYPKR
jgi:phosphoribosylanthranilate isomerase